MRRPNGLTVRCALLLVALTGLHGLRCGEGDVLCDCQGGCPDTGGACLCDACGSCTACGSCECCVPVPIVLPDAWHEEVRENKAVVTDTPCAAHLLPNFGNGYLGSQFGSPWMFASGVFNGGGVFSHRASIPYPFPITLTSESLLPGSGVRLSFEEGTVTRLHRLNGGPAESTVTVTHYMHHAQPHLVVVEVTVDNRGDRSVEIHIHDGFTAESHDMNFAPPLRATNAPVAIDCARAITTEPEAPTVPLRQLAMCRTVPPTTLHAAPHGVAKLKLVASVWDSPLISQTPGAEETGFQAALDDVERASVSPALLASHTQSIRTNLWAHRMEIIGNPELARMVNSSWWNILLSTREGTRQSLSPGGLPNNCYQGHVFWDTEQFIWPNLLLLHPDLAKACIDYRFDRIDAATRKARQEGFAGSQFPWESAITGNEASPASATGKYQIHISGDVALAVWQFFQASKDLHWLRNTGWPLLQGVAEFYASRASARAEGGFSLRNVMGVDEGHYPVDDASYVNAVASLALRSAEKAIKLLGIEGVEHTNWTAIADGLHMPMDAAGEKHLDYHNMRRGSNGLGVVLLGYPLDVPMPRRVRENDLKFYSTQWPAANAMYWWAFSVAWNELGNHDEADKFFRKTTARNVFKPFDIWSEDPGGHGCPNFITGAGAFLQAVWVGYLGIRLGDAFLEFRNPRVPPDTEEVRVLGIQFSGGCVDAVMRGQSLVLRACEDVDQRSLLVAFASERPTRLTRHGHTFSMPAHVRILPAVHPHPGHEL